jgi:hypothetical protein
MLGMHTELEVYDITVTIHTRICPTKIIIYGLCMENKLTYSDILIKIKYDKM